MATATTTTETKVPAVATRPPLIGIRGRMGAGKDTLKDIIVARYGYAEAKFAGPLRDAASAITRLPVSDMQTEKDKARDLSAQMYDPLVLLDRIRSAIKMTVPPGYVMNPDVAKQMYTTITGWPAPNANEPDNPLTCKPMNIRMTVGQLLQVLGTECFRERIGANVWVEAFYRNWEQGGRLPTVVADTRFPNESAAIRAAGGVVVLVERPEKDREAAAAGRSARHPSETALDGEPADVVISNSGTIGDLEAALDRVWPAIERIAQARRR